MSSNLVGIISQDSFLNLKEQQSREGLSEGTLFPNYVMLLVLGRISSFFPCIFYRRNSNEGKIDMESIVPYFHKHSLICWYLLSVLIKTKYDELPITRINKKVVTFTCKSVSPRKIYSFLSFTCGIKERYYICLPSRCRIHSPCVHSDNWVFLSAKYRPKDAMSTKKKCESFFLPFFLHT